MNNVERNTNEDMNVSKMSWNCVCVRERERDRETKWYRERASELNKQRTGKILVDLVKFDWYEAKIERNSTIACFYLYISYSLMQNKGYKLQPKIWCKLSSEFNRKLCMKMMHAVYTVYPIYNIHLEVFTETYYFVISYSFTSVYYFFFFSRQEHNCLLRHKNYILVTILNWWNTFCIRIVENSELYLCMNIEQYRFKFILFFTW